ncbi:radical SAM protein [Cytobacillus sp. Hz8]|uniref:radical SAM protein n=1 Tax=Cytobacillus sp. Hz8 TaxID=3347168 RepID=UPI0035D759E0
MIRKVSIDNLSLIKNKSFNEYAQIYTNIEAVTLKNIESFGLSLQPRQPYNKKNLKLKQLEEKGAVIRNNKKSIMTTRISSACEACQTGTGSYTTYTSLKCHRHCYFCFNPNQDDYEFYKDQQKDIEKELLQLLESGVKLKHLALTGGEPLLFKDEMISFFELANQKTPETYTRLYTTGDLLDEETLQRLQKTKLNEIRFSIKMEDSIHKINHIFRKIELAQKYIPNILVEMPVIPGTLNEMKELLLKLDQLGVFGINLLEFCFPLGNAKAFKERGFQLKNPPYEMFYNYWYAGGLAVAESEEACLELVEFALQENLQLGVHYCSLENKYTGQIYQQNLDRILDETYSYSNLDYFFKTVKVFGKDRKKAAAILGKNLIPFYENSNHDFLQFPIEAIHYLKNKNIELAISSNVVEFEEGESQIREIALDWTTPDLFEIEDVFLKEEGGEK